MAWDCRSLGAGAGLQGCDDENLIVALPKERARAVADASVCEWCARAGKVEPVRAGWGRGCKRGPSSVLRGTNQKQEIIPNSEQLLSLFLTSHFRTTSRLS